MKIAGRSISSLIKYQGRGDLDRMQLQSRRYGIDFNLAPVPIFSFSDRDWRPLYFRYMGVVGVAAGGAAGEIAKVSHTLKPCGRSRASNSP